MPLLDLTEMELKAAWILLDHVNYLLPPQLRDAELSLFQKVYHAYRGIPPRAA